MEEGDLEKASDEKTRLEEKQRKFLKSHPDYKPNWFKKNGDDWEFTGKYWVETDKSHIISLF
jgi:hypothetical protein